MIFSRNYFFIVWFVISVKICGYLKNAPSLPDYTVEFRKSFYFKNKNQHKSLFIISQTNLFINSCRGEVFNGFFSTYSNSKGVSSNPSSKQVLQ